MDRLANITTLRAFVTVAHLGSVSRAAEALHLTQPAISHQIKRLAEDTGVTLFRRTPRGLEITAEGAEIVTKAEAVLGAMADFQRSARQQGGRISGRLRIGTVVDPEFIRLGRLLGQLRTSYPGIATELAHGVSGDVVARLRRGQIDAGYHLTVPEAGAEVGQEALHTVRLADVTYRIIAPAGWDALVETDDWGVLAALPWIGTPEASVHSRLLAGILVQAGCTQNVVAMVDQEASMLEMVRAGVGLSLCRESIALHQRQTAGLAMCSGISVPASLSFSTLARRADDPLIAVLFDLLGSHWR
ncbi:LysR family transcriptional regulator [Loktanella sp. R86503]|uniref:LysR family transcriptional regulator n=1 Tax=Loktanella sp. R86503 TaxID=3093847 RepID=UPI0036DA7ED1